jgi:hypothetical protein
MARILYWNIRQFAINKIDAPRAKRRWDGSFIIPPQPGYRKRVIRTTITQNKPDIFVVVETSTGAGAAGTLISAGGADGSIFLLQQMRTWFPGDDWRLIPR